MPTVTTDDLVEQLVTLTHGWSGPETQRLYRQALQALVELAKFEQKNEIDYPQDCRRVLRGLPH